MRQLACYMRMSIAKAGLSRGSPITEHPHAYKTGIHQLISTNWPRGRWPLTISRSAVWCNSQVLWLSIWKILQVRRLYAWGDERASANGAESGHVSVYLCMHVLMHAYMHACLYTYMYACMPCSSSGSIENVTDSRRFYIEIENFRQLRRKCGIWHHLRHI